LQSTLFLSLLIYWTDIADGMSIEGTLRPTAPEPTRLGYRQISQKLGARGGVERVTSTPDLLTLAVNQMSVRLVF
jgi:hypothetical protein